MNKIRLFKWILAIAVLSLASCREEFDDHYNSVNEAMGLSVTQLLESKGDFSLFVEMIRNAGLERTLNESGLYTCLAPRDEHVQAYLDDNGWTLQTIPERKLIEYINYHFIVDRYFLYDFEYKYNRFENDWRYNLEYSKQVTFPTRGDDKHQSKYIRIFTKPYFEARDYDYLAYTGIEGADFMVENVKVSEEERDFPMLNGVLHVLDGPLTPPLRADEALAANSDFSILTAWLDQFDHYDSGKMDDKGNIDTTRIKYYNISVSPGSKVTNIADETISFVIIAPTDQAIRSKLDQYMTPEQLVHYDSIPQILMINMLRSLISSNSSNSAFWGLSDMARNYPYFISESSTILPIANDITGMNPKGIISSNAVIYKVDQMPEIPLLQSVEAGLHINFKRYKQWQKMIENNYLYVNATDNTSYQHPPKTILIQPDESLTAWTNPENGRYGVDAWDANYQDTLGMRLRAGILDYMISDGQFEHRFYPAPYGHILYEDGFFFDYKRNPARLLSEEPTWEGVNGGIYEIDGIFEHLLSTDSTQLMYRTQLTKELKFTRFKQLIDKAEQQRLLDQTRTVFTVFAPVDSVFDANGYTAAHINQLSKEEALLILNDHIARDVRVFTDGKTQTVNTVGGMRLTISGSWDTFRISTTRGISARVQEEVLSNMQFSNGVLHGINNLLIDR